MKIKDYTCEAWLTEMLFRAFGLISILYLLNDLNINNNPLGLSPVLGFLISIIAFYPLISILVNIFIKIILRLEEALIDVEERKIVFYKKVINNIKDKKLKEKVKNYFIECKGLSEIGE